MTGLNYVTRRGAIYDWRRRLPAWVSQASYLQISLRTPRFSTAKILANLVTAGFATCINRMMSQRITQAEAQRFLSDLVVRQLEKIEELRYYEPDAPTPEDWRQLAEWLKDKGVKHSHRAPYHPQTQGKIPLVTLLRNALPRSGTLELNFEEPHSAGKPLPAKRSLRPRSKSSTTTTLISATTRA